MIAVTQTFFPPLEEYNHQLERIWKSKWLTNRGALVLELEEKIKNRLQCGPFFITNNGTIPIQIALKLLGQQGEIITTSFSYVATASSIVWENCKPVFVDIHPDYLTIDEEKIEAAITPKSTCILATHVFGNPCHTQRIQEIAQKHNLHVIYDAAHAFGVNYLGKSIFDYGNISTCSFHATKIFHTAEGGALFCKDEALFHKAYYSHNFGHNGPLDFHGLGINAKISEIQAAMGLTVLPYFAEILECRKNIVEHYQNGLSKMPIRFQSIRKHTEWNYSYLPVIFQDEKTLLHVQKTLNDEQIFPRRYFYPSLNTISYLKQENMPVSESISSRILCLPLFKDLQNKDVQRIIDCIGRACQ